MITRDILHNLDDFSLHDADGQLTSSVIKKQIQIFCTYFRSLGISKGAHVAILLKPSNVFALTIYSILYYGAVYIPLDMDSPVTRLQFQINDAKALWVIGTGNKPEWCQSNWLDVTSLPESNEEFVAPDIMEDDPAAILYTSGSTGTPKGVVISHRAIAHFVQWCIKTFAITKTDKIVNIAAFHFDLSLLDLFASIITGIPLYITPRDYLSNPVKLEDWFYKNAITLIYTVPSALQFFVNRKLLTKCQQTLRMILFAAEVMPLSTLKKLVGDLPNTQFYNLFGPTETNVCCYWQVSKEAIESLTHIPIGQIVEGLSYKIADSGELLIKGPSVMSGYLKNDAYSLQVDREGYYATGDKVTLAAGLLHYHGRLDNIIKFNGYRIEPLEIETAINNISGIMNTYVYLENPTALVACYESAHNLSALELRKQLKDKLPDCMLPTHFIHFSRFGKLSNGKLDQVKLKQQVQENYFTHIAKERL